MALSLLTSVGPKRKDRRHYSKDRRHYSYEEDVDEPPSLVEKESTDIEKENPIDDTDPIEQVEEQEADTPPIFEE